MHEVGFKIQRAKAKLREQGDMKGGCQVLEEARAESYADRADYSEVRDRYLLD